MPSQTFRSVVRWGLVAILSATIIVASRSAAQPISFTFTIIDVPGASSTEAHGVNGLGQVVGRFTDATGEHGFLKDGDTFTTIDVLFGDLGTTRVNGINGTPQVVGRFKDATGEHGFLMDGANFTGFDASQANGINAIGQIVGRVGIFIPEDPLASTLHGFLGGGSTFTIFDVPTATCCTEARGLNETGQMVGIFDNPAHGFLKDGDTFTTIDVPGAAFTQANGINQTGQIVGFFGDATTEHGFLSDADTFTVVDFPGALLTEIWGINDIGQIVGRFMDATGTHGFTATPSAITGLDFPGSAAVATTMRFKFADPQDNDLPIYGPEGSGVTYIWRAYPRQQSGFYTAFFWGNDDGQGNINTFLWADGAADSYYGAHPYPRDLPNDDTHDWEISIEQNDYVNGAVVYNRWYTQALRVWSDATGKHHEFYWDLPNTDASHRATHDSPRSWGNRNPPAPALTWGDAPWNPGHEVWNGILRGFQIYSALLSLADIQSEATAPLSTSAGRSNIWYLNSNPTPTDISDKSGEGNHPAWVGSERPALYTGSTPPPPSSPTNFRIEMLKVRSARGSTLTTEAAAGVSPARMAD